MINKIYLNISYTYLNWLIKKKRWQNIDEQILFLITYFEENHYYHYMSYARWELSGEYLEELGAVDDCDCWVKEIFWEDELKVEVVGKN